MATQEVVVPDFNFAAFFYPDLLQALINFKRKNAPELTDESDFEPAMQFLKAFAIVGHLNNVLLDVVANELAFKPAKLPESVRDSLRLIGYEMKSATPSTVDVLYKLSKTFAVSTVLIPDSSRAATVSDDSGSPTIYFETAEGLTIARSDQFGAVFGGAYVSPGVYTYTNATTFVNAGTLPPFSVAAKDVLLFGHADVIWDDIGATVNAQSDLGIGVWEYFDGSFEDTHPTSVVDLGNGRLTLGVNSLLGDSNRAGALVKVRLAAGLTAETVESYWDGENKIEIGLLGQTVPSAVVDDYLAGTDWKELNNVTDNTALFDATGHVTFELPQTATSNWKKTTISGFTGYFLRFRIVTLGPSIVSSTLSLGRIRMDQGKQYVVMTAVQGRSVIAESLGSSNGDDNQTFQTQQTDFIFGSEEVRVDGVAWTRVSNFLNSEPADQHYRVELVEKDRAEIVFGDGANGKIPPVGIGNIVIDYRFGANDNGNVGANTITVDKQSLSFIEAITNPRAAAGWAASQAADAASLEQAKEEGVASIRARDVALSPDDAVDLTIAFIDSNGAKPFARARAFEESYGPKTVEMVCVAHGGGLATQPQLDELALYFNGDKDASPPLKKHFVSNQQIIATNYDPLVVDVDVTVYGPADTDKAAIVAALSGFLDPEAREPDGVTWKWNFSDEIDRGRISHEVFVVDKRIRKVAVNSPATNPQLGNRQLPKPGSIYVTLIPTT